MNKPLILVVEDDLAVARLISTTLETRNYQYHRVQNGAGALLEAASARPDVILLDLGLPDMDGIDVIRKIRGWSNVPILVVSARSDDTDKVSALDAGADDYLTKPFSVEELLARLRVARGAVCGMILPAQVTRPAYTRTENCALTMPQAVCTAAERRFT